jgi:hypothetical protein
MFEEWRLKDILPGKSANADAEEELDQDRNSSKRANALEF